jgi:branched-chain amino acid transport system permease protein
MSKQNIVSVVLVVVVVAALSAAPLVVDSDTPINLLTSIFIYAMLASSWNVLGGFTGQVSLGHAAFFGAGALATRLLWTTGLPLVPSLLAGGVAAWVLAMVIGGAAFRLRGVYFTIGTLALGQILFITVGNVLPKIAQLPPVEIATYDLTRRYYVILAVGVFSVAAAYALVKSRFGLGMMAVRENEDAAESLGVNAFTHKMLALGVSAFLAGLAGGAFAYYHVGYYYNYPFSPPWSLDVMTMAYIGGVGTIVGPLVGSAFYVVLKELLVLSEEVGEYHLIVFGVLFILVVLFLPGGLMELWERIRGAIARRGNRKASQLPPPELEES